MGEKKDVLFNPPLDWGEAPSTWVINLAPPNIADDVCWQFV